jgi:hypothetical protein
MTIYEYKVISLVANYRLEEELNALGVEGWHVKFYINEGRSLLLERMIES